MGARARQFYTREALTEKHHLGKLSAMNRKVTEFESRVYAMVSRVPRGRVTTYACLARALGCGSAQAVGQALKRNPFAPEVPCHRVIRTDLNIGGYAGQVGGEKLETKLTLLRDEGVDFDDSGCLVDSKILFLW